MAGIPGNLLYTKLSQKTCGVRDPQAVRVYEVLVGKSRDL